MAVGFMTGGIQAKWFFTLLLVYVQYLLLPSLLFLQHV